jgi:hypothetical protein
MTTGNGVLSFFSRVVSVYTIYDLIFAIHRYSSLFSVRPVLVEWVCGTRGVCLC